MLSIEIADVAWIAYGLSMGVAERMKETSKELTVIFVFFIYIY